ncbi:hypothetical protein H0H93_012546 [Arthromyces matolae]|nr:hypothetical protein H0H93_012546 [Arthromyces matolae]
MKLAHAVYKHFEPKKPQAHVVLIVLAPLVLSLLLIPQFNGIIVAFCYTSSIYILTLVTSTVAYRLSPFHPLAKYPGPILCKVSKLYHVTVAFNGKQHGHYRDLHRRYGDIVRTVWDGQFPYQKQHRTMVGIRNPQAHANVRRIWARGFAPEAMRGYQPILHNRIAQLLNHLGERAGEVVNLGKWISWFAYDVMNDMAFGDDVATMQTQDSGGLYEVIEETAPIGIIMAHLPWFSELLITIPSLIKKGKAFRNSCRTRVIKRLEKGSDTRDLIYHLVDEGGQKGTALPVEQIVSDAALMVVAGADTVAPALSSLFYFLLSNPTAYSRLQSEIESSGLAEEDLNIAHLEYLNAVINETLRVIPPILSGTSRSPLIGSGGVRLGEHFIPEGTTVGLHTLTMHRDARNFHLPEMFLPERWLSEEKQLALEPIHFKDRDRVVHNTAAYLPFSTGPADCVGKRFALQEIRAVVFAVLKRFTLRLEEGYDRSRWERDLLDFFVLTKGKLPVILTPK